MFFLSQYVFPHAKRCQGFLNGCYSIVILVEVFCLFFFNAPTTAKQAHVLSKCEDTLRVRSSIAKLDIQSTEIVAAHEHDEATSKAVIFYSLLVLGPESFLFFFLVL